MKPATYEELNDLPSLVNSLKALAHHAPFTELEIVLVANAATAIEGLMKDREALALDLHREREARRIVDQALAAALREIKAANDAA